MMEVKNYNFDKKEANLEGRSKNMTILAKKRRIWKEEVKKLQFWRKEANLEGGSKKFQFW